MLEKELRRIQATRDKLVVVNDGIVESSETMEQNEFEDGLPSKCEMEKARMAMDNHKVSMEILTDDYDRLKVNRVQKSNYDGLQWP